jgi:hypothetical protein
MGVRLVACPSCARHVRVGEGDCPFCGRSLGDSFGARPLPPPPAASLSRGERYLLGVGILAGVVTSGAVLAACNPSSPSAIAAYGAPPPTAVEPPSPSVSPEASPPMTGEIYGAPPPMAAAYGAPPPMMQGDGAAPPATPDAGAHAPGTQPPRKK